MLKKLKNRIAHRVTEVSKTTVKIGDVQCQWVVWSDEQLKLKEEIKNHQYKPNGEYPSISLDNVCTDGNHRLISLKEYYDEDYEIVVWRHKRTYRYLAWYSVIYYLFLQKV